MSEAGVQRQEVVKREATADELLRWLDADPWRASQKYDRVFRKLVRFFAAQGCADSENLAGEALARTYQALSTGLELTAQLETFLFGVAKMILLEEHRRQRQAAIPLEALPAEQEPRVDPPSHLPGVPKWQQELYHACCEKCLHALGEAQCAQVLRFYEGRGEGEMKSNRKRLAAQLGINTRALSSRMLRVREKLEQCITACVNGQGAKQIP